jgi:PAS domain S-box-containing protein
VSRERRRTSLPLSVAWFGAGLVAVAIAAGVLADRAWSGPRPNGPLAVAALAALMVLAGTFVIEFRSGDDVSALDLFDVVLAPLLLAVSPLVAIAIVGASKTVSQSIHRVEPPKAAFNVAQWMAATALGAWVLAALRADRALAGQTLAALVLGLLVAAVANHVAVTVVIRLAQRRSLRDVARDFAPVVFLGWVVAGTINISVGVIMAVSWTAVPAVSVLFLVPLLGLHRASRAQADARVQHDFLDGLHRATRTLAAMAAPRTAIPRFLDDVRECLGCYAVELTLIEGDSTTWWYSVAGEPARSSAGNPSPLTSALLDLRRSVRITATTPDATLTPLLREAGWSSAVAVPVGRPGAPTGLLCTYDRRGYGLFEGDHVVVLEAMASELDSALRRGHLFDEVKSEKAKLADIIDSTSDGIATIDRDGRVASWNAGFAELSGFGDDEMRAAGIDALGGVDRFGVPVQLSTWSTGQRLPAEFAIQRMDGQTRWLSCSYSPSPTGDRLVVVARDVTEAWELAAAEAALRSAEARAQRARREVEGLDAEVARLSEREEAQRNVVHELQKAVFPAAPTVADTELGVYYVCADDTAPTGGDLYDWVTMPNGDLHLAVVDIVGHGVAATKRALAVTHALRLLALQDIGLEHMIARADSLLGVSNPDLQATVIVARYRPTSGELIVAGGGHPPAVHISSSRKTELVAAPGIPIGWPGAGTHAVARTVLAPGDSLVLYTDGLIEAGRDILAGLNMLEELASEEAHRPAPDLARVLVERTLASGERRDDALALVLRRSAGGETDPAARFVHRLTPNRAEVPIARRRFATWLASRFEESVDVDELTLVVSELCANAIVAARTSVVLRVWSVGISLVIEVEDDGDAVLEPSVDGVLDDSTIERGRGLLIAKRLADEFTIQSDEYHTLVHFERRIAAPVPAPTTPLR